MKRKVLLLFFCALIGLPSVISAQEEFEKDIFTTGGGKLEMTFIGHGTLMFSCNDLVIHVDPVSREADYSTMPDADIILITHEHGDHLDHSAIRQIRKVNTVIICNESSSEGLEGCIVMENGDSRRVRNISVKAVPAYNIVHKRSSGKPFHPKGNGNGYLLTIRDKEVYVAGDTENIPEMADLGEVDIAFLPVNLPYTMSLQMAADAAKMIKPEILYPYHYGATEISELAGLLDETDIEVRIRKLQ
ncbi:MAG: MBL fold metallo-hydrolase [Bacteroidales bacterium]|nr:MBL fold metallo-hydrolase [Bacteroidales bacterium]